MDINALIAVLRANATQPPVEIARPFKGWEKIYARPATLVETAKLQGTQYSEDDLDTKLARQVTAMLCDETGAPLFDATNDEHVGMIRDQGWERLRRIRDAVDDDGGVTAEGN